MARGKPTPGQSFARKMQQPSLTKQGNLYQSGGKPGGPRTMSLPSGTIYRTKAAAAPPPVKPKSKPRGPYPFSYGGKAAPTAKKKPFKPPRTR